MNKILIIIIVCLFCGCASMSLGGVDYISAQKGFPNNNTSIIYIIRDEATPTGFGSKIIIDGKKIGVLKNKSFTWVEIVPGEKTIIAKWPLIAGQEDSIINIYAERKKTYYIVLTHDYTTSKGAFSPYVMYNKFVEVNENSALSKMKEMQYFRSK